MNDKRPTADEALKAFCEGCSDSRTSDSVTISGLNAVAALFGGFGPERAQVPLFDLQIVEVSQGLVGLAGLSGSRSGKICAAVAARSNAWEAIKDRVHEIVGVTCRGSGPGSTLLTASNLAIALRDLLTSPKFGTGPEPKP